MSSSAFGDSVAGAQRSLWRAQRWHFRCLTQPSRVIAAFNSYLHQTGLIKYAGRIAPRNAFTSPDVLTGELRISPITAANRQNNAPSSPAAGQCVTGRGNFHEYEQFFRATSPAAANGFGLANQTKLTLDNSSDWYIELGIKYQFRASLGGGGAVSHGAALFLSAAFLSKRAMMSPVPAEWAPHHAIWVGFPSHAELWEDDLAPAQDEVAALARALATEGGERVRLLVCGEAAAEAAESRLAGAPVEIVPGRFGDIWLRDTGPIFLGGGHATAFRFNGWGGKYVLDGDETVAEQLASAADACLRRHDFVLEGGAVEHDGEGTVLTTRECLTNPNRNRGWTQAQAESALAEALGARKVIWLDRGLIGDHTDGHVDNLARFVAPATVAVPMAFGADDPHAAIYDAAAETLARAADAAGRPLKVARIPSPGRVLGSDRLPVPASHMNFVIANRAVVMPTYNDRAAGFALEALKMLFPDRAVIGLASRSLLTGGGSFHCITQQEPA